MLDEALLWDASDSPLCLKARICLQVKRVPFRRVTLTLGRMRALGRLNPRRTVPVLVHGEHVLIESSRIARYLESRYPEPSLMPADEASRAYVLLLESWADEALGGLVGALTWLDPAQRPAALANTVDEVAGRALRPLLRGVVRRRQLRRFAAQGYQPDMLAELQGRMRGHLALLGELLGDRPCLLGESPTLADIAIFVQLASCGRYGGAGLLGAVPAVRDWLARLARIPPIAAALSP